MRPTINPVFTSANDIRINKTFDSQTLEITQIGLVCSARADRSWHCLGFTSTLPSDQSLHVLHFTHDMVKRQAEEALEEVAAQGSPVSKKARVQDLLKTSGHTGHTNGFSSVSDLPDQSNGMERGSDERAGDGILAAADHEQEELEETLSPIDDTEIQDEQSAFSAASRQQAPTEGYSDLYLDTIDRGVLDFDFEKLCSVTLSNINVYACLVCGKYYQGRGPRSHAYYHALEVGHNVYVNMQTKKVYVLPEGYEVKSKSLDDIKFVVDPQLSRDEVVRLDKEAKDAWDLGGKKYRPGMLDSP